MVHRWHVSFPHLGDIFMRKTTGACGMRLWEMSTGFCNCNMMLLSVIYPLRWNVVSFHVIFLNGHMVVSICSADRLMWYHKLIWSSGYAHWMSPPRGTQNDRKAEEHRLSQIDFFSFFSRIHVHTQHTADSRQHSTTANSVTMSQCSVPLLGRKRKFFTIPSL